jgi:hypothetical protein
MGRGSTVGSVEHLQHVEGKAAGIIIITTINRTGVW